MLNVGDLEQCWHAGFKQRHRRNSVEFDARRGDRLIVHRSDPKRATELQWDWKGGALFTFSRFRGGGQEIVGDFLFLVPPPMIPEKKLKKN